MTSPLCDGFLTCETGLEIEASREAAGGGHGSVADWVRVGRGPEGRSVDARCCY